MLQKLTALAIKGGGAVRESSRMPLVEYLKAWLVNEIEKKKAATTHAYYKGIFEKHLEKRLGGVTLEGFDSERARRLFDEIGRAKLGATVPQRCYCVLRSALNKAVKRGFLSENSLSRVDAPIYREGERRSLPLQQVGALLKAAKKGPLEALYVLAVTSGTRQGELFALRWSDIDLDEARLSVNGTLQSVGSKLTVSAPKTPNSRRRVELTAPAVAALRKRFALTEKDGHGSPYVFAGADGGLPRKNNFMGRSFRPLLERAEIPIETTFHALRHTAASVLLLQGANPKVVSELLGHADIRLTLKTYSDVLPDLQRQAANAMERALRAAKRKPSGGQQAVKGRKKQVRRV